MMSSEEINKCIEDMGYVISTPQKKLVPSFYKLEDGTILSVLLRINHLLQNDNPDPHYMNINMTPEINVFTHPEKRNIHNNQDTESQNINSSIINDDVECTPLREEYNTYDLSNGWIMNVKTIVGQIKKTDLVNEIGEPIYDVGTHPIIRFKKK